jgi:hypothetical protein
LVGGHLHDQRHREAERLGGLEVDQRLSTGYPRIARQFQARREYMLMLSTSQVWAALAAWVIGAVIYDIAFWLGG